MAFFNLVQCFSTVSGMWPIFETHRANVFGLWPIFETHRANVCGTWPDYIFSKHAGHVARLYIFETRRARGPIIYFRNTQGTWPDYIFFTISQATSKKLSKKISGMLSLQNKKSKSSEKFSNHTRCEG